MQAMLFLLHFLEHFTEIYVFALVAILSFLKILVYFY